MPENKPSEAEILDEAKHVENAVIFNTTDADEHNFVQVGNEIRCDGAGKHPPHGFMVDSRLVLRRQLPDGSLEFEDVVKGTLTRKV